MRHELLNIARIGAGNFKVTALIARRIAGFTAIEMALAAFALQELSALGHLHALGDGLGGLLLHMDRVRTCDRQWR